MLFQKPFTIKVKKGFLHMNGITLALTRFWQNKQISLPPMSTLLIGAVIMFFCFRLIVNGNRKEQEDAGILCSYLTYWMQTGAVT